MNELIFLPDREGRDELSSTTGFVRVGKDASALRRLTERMVLPKRESAVTDGTMWRGVLALALLLDAWPDADARLVMRDVDGTSSRFAAWVLSARPEEERRDVVHLLLLEKDGKQALLGIADAQRGLALPATPSDLTKMIPARAAWYDAQQDIWHDPIPYLNEQERAVLYARLQLMSLGSLEAAAFKAALANAETINVQQVREEKEDAIADLSTRIQAVCGLKHLPPFAVREEQVRVEKDHPLVRVFSPVDVRYGGNTAAPCTYLWQGVPFARTSAALGLTAPCGVPQEEVLANITEELLMLTENSTRFNRRVADGIDQWLCGQDEALLPQVRAQAETIRAYQLERSREVQSAVTLTWPWRQSSSAVQALLQENLGDGWRQAVEIPFCEKLTKLTGHVLGDTALQSCCACADGVLIPPLSREMALCVAASRDGEGLAADAIRFEPREDGGVTASILLRGLGEVRLVRAYAPDELLVLEEGDCPTVAVWPCVPMPRWKAYHVFSRGGSVHAAALCRGEWRRAEQQENTPWPCIHTDGYPACIVLEQDGMCLGALPNALPEWKIDPRGDAVAAIDLGDCATAVALTVDGQLVSAEGRELTRLLVSPIDMPADDFLVSLTPTAVTPSSVALTGPGDTLFTDGYAYAVSSFDRLRSLPEGVVHTALKWRADANSLRAKKILLHQVMLGMSLNAMLCGVETLRWRVTVPDEMAEEGRKDLLDMVEDLSAQVAAETGLPAAPGKNAVLWAEEASAIHAFLCNEGRQIGTFAVVDVGGGSTKMHLWMQGRVRPSAGAVLMEGARNVLLRAFRDNPDALRADFADCGDGELISAVDALCTQLARSGEGRTQVDKALLMLDALLENWKAAIIRQLYVRYEAQRPTHMQSVLMELFCGAMFSLGLMLEQAGGDDTLPHLFPSDLTISFTGRGAWLLETLTPQLRNALQHMAHAPVSLRHPVRSVTIRVSSQGALGTALGMTSLKQTELPGDLPPVRTRQSFTELMRQMMQQMIHAFPQHVWLLHPGLIDQWGRLTPAGEDTVRRVASQVYGDGEDIPAAVMEFLAQLRKTSVASDPYQYER